MLMTAITNPETDLIIWSPDWSVGSSTLDDDHKAFFKIADLLANGQKSSDHLFIDSAIAILDEYVDGHFYREEKAMQAVSYPRLSDHRLKHLRFKSRVRAIGEEVAAGRYSAADGLPKLIGEWLVQHILKDDKLYVNWINESVIDNRPLAFLALEASPP